jgi:hypothetical protein
VNSVCGEGAPTPRVQDLLFAFTVCDVEHRHDQSCSLHLRHCIVLMQISAVRRVEDKIRSLSAQLLAVEEDKELRPMLAELRDALRQHIERLRVRLSNYPIVVERRDRNGIPRRRRPREAYLTRTAPQAR